ncbi:unnamed protein product [Vicia faba]|uniref:Uncharacterized protein n=1 Tax=Vicia faba TaxID=3906 RepID=A0AAV1AGH5_VICFA|nr:unnamed protein product [Vicia faba]
MFPQFGATVESLSKASTMIFRIGTDVHLYDDPEDINIAPLIDYKFQMTLADLLDESKMVLVSYGDLEVEINGIQHDSRLVISGNLFVCCVGSKNDGHMFLREADKRGYDVVKLTLITVTSLPYLN